MNISEVIEKIKTKYSKITWDDKTNRITGGSNRGYYFQYDKDALKEIYENQLKNGTIYYFINSFTDGAIKENETLSNYVVLTRLKDNPKSMNIEFTKKGPNNEDNLSIFKEKVKNKESNFTLTCDFFDSYFFRVIGENDTESLKELERFLDGISKEIKQEVKNTKEEENDQLILPSVNTILYGPPGTGKTYNSVKYAVDTVDEYFNKDSSKKFKNYVERFNELKAAGQIGFATFHQSYAYEEFIEGIKPFLGKRGVRRGRSDLNYKISDGVFKEFCNKAASDRSNKYVFIIDEINRGNISKIFGELITLIEDSKRAGENEAMSVTLPYSQEEFSVPENVYILGTMNTADRSIALMDTALRRRFEFIEMMPKYTLLENVWIKVIEDKEDKKNKEDQKKIDIQKMLEKMNQRIEVLYDREHTLGHAFFIPLKNKEKATLDQLASIFKNKIIPLLQEYFYEDYEKIMLVLGIDPQNEDDSKFISVKNNDGIFKNSKNLDLNPVYQINKEAFQTPDNYMTIYDGASNSGEADETKGSDS